VDPTAGLDVMKKSISYPCQESNPGPCSPQPSHCTNYSIPYTQYLCRLCSIYQCELHVDIGIAQWD
jgi:hypothetical protein